jgi:uncharacterized protein HemY
MLKALEPPDTHYLSAAEGWIGLGNLPEAQAELERISAEMQGHPDVLNARWHIHAAQGGWSEGLEVARALVKAAPDRVSSWLHQAYAIRRAPEGSLEKAWAALLPAVDMFPGDFMVCYNLSCYACQMNQIETARHWLKRAAEAAGKEKIKTMALEDADLQPMWGEIEKL